MKSRRFNRRSKHLQLEPPEPRPIQCYRLNNMSHKPFGRRSFLKSAGATLTTALFTGNLRGANDRPTGAFIGVGMMGTENLKVALDLGVEVRAVCDVYRAHRER